MLHLYWHGYCQFQFRVFFIKGVVMFLDWITLVGLISVLGVFGLLAYFCRTQGCGT